MKFRSSRLSATLLVIALVALAFIYVQSEETTGEPARRDADITLAGSRYTLTPLELSAATEKAAKGDCPAATRLSDYHRNITLQYESALKWTRMAAKCDGVTSRLKLIFLLRPLSDRVEVRTEIDSLVREIGEIEPKSAAQLREDIDQWQLTEGVQK